MSQFCWDRHMYADWYWLMWIEHPSFTVLYSKIQIARPSQEHYTSHTCSSRSHLAPQNLEAWWTEKVLPGLPISPSERSIRIPNGLGGLISNSMLLLNSHHWHHIHHVKSPLAWPLKLFPTRGTAAEQRASFLDKPFHRRDICPSPLEPFFKCRIRISVI